MKLTIIALLLLQSPQSNKMPDFKKAGIEEQVIYNTSDVIVRGEVLNTNMESVAGPFIIMPHAGMRIESHILDRAKGQSK